MASLQTRRGTVSVEPDAVTLQVSPLTHARRILGSWHGPVWLLALTGYVFLDGPLTWGNALTSLLIATAAFTTFIGGLWLLRYHSLPLPRTTTLPKDTITRITPRIGMNRETWHTTTLFDIDHGGAHTTVAPLDDTRFDTLLADHGYPYDY